MPFFSIIIPLYNKEKFIENTIQSVLGQSFEDFELIVVNDGSTDKSLELVNKLKDKRIKTYSISNAGVSKARNFGIQKATSKLIVFLDADDLWKNNHLQELYKLRKAHPNCGLYAMGYTKKFDNADPIHAYYFGLEKHSGVVDDFFLSSIVDCIAWTSALMVPKIVFQKLGGFNDGLKTSEDTEMWIRIALNYPVAFCWKMTACKVQRSDENHLSMSKLRVDSLKIFKQFEAEEINNLSLKRFLDLNRFSMALDRKKSGDFKNYKLLKESINIKNLNAKQRLLLKLPKQCLVLLKKLQYWLLKKNIYLSPFKG
ncbi:MAG: glycosyltransferase family A protein [Bacteroidota bacterium]|nr:glycosyltransferase family A protein [Bacteroidota bacterium]